MKRLMLLLGVFLMGMPLLRAQSGTPTKKVAILEVVDRDNAINYGVKLLLRTTLAKAITQTQGYEGYDRVDMMAIQGEQDFQRTGMVSDEQIKRLGEMTGAAYVLVAEAAKIDASNMIVTAKILDVETAKLERTDYEQMGLSANEMAEGCRNMASRLLVSVVPVVSEGNAESSKAGASSKKVQRRNNGYEETLLLDTMSKVYVPSGEVVFKGGQLKEMDTYGFTRALGKTNTRLYLGDFYKEYRKAMNTQIVGISCMSVGGGLAAVGISMVLCHVLDKVKFSNDGYFGGYAAYYYKNYPRGVYFEGGMITASVGVALIIAGAPTYVVANKRLHKILQIAREQKGVPPYKTACTFDFNPRNGIGINLKF